MSPVLPRPTSRTPHPTPLPSVSPQGALPFVYLLPVLMRWLARLRPGVGAPVYIPSSLLRYITFQLSHDLQRIPALRDLLRAGLRLLLSGDASQWDRALQVWVWVRGAEMLHSVEREGVGLAVGPRPAGVGVV